jgi:glycosyltransferase involved in cell wall biosynthesis
MRRDRLDLFHDPVYPLPFLLPVPGVITVHDLSGYEVPGVHGARAALAARLYPSHLRRASMIIADSFYTASRITRLFPWASDKVEVVPLGVSDAFRRVERGEETTRVAEKYALPSRFMLFLGTLEPRKNLDRLLSAFQSVAGDIPHWLVIAGGLGWKYQKLLERISDHPMRSRIILTGFVDDANLPVLLSMAEFLVYPSLLEGFGLPVLEAMACGTPVLTSDTSSMPEIAGEAAHLVNPLSIESIENGIRLLATDGSYRESLSEKGIQRASGFKWRNTAEKTLDVYERVLKKHRGQLP